MADHDNDPDVLAAIEFFANWFAYTEGVIELRAIGGKRPRRSMITSGKQTEQFIARSHKAGEEIYFGVATRLKGATGGKKVDCWEAPGAHLDLDLTKNGLTYDDGIAIIERFPVQPSAVVWSGGGMHCYWRFDEAWNLRDDVEGDPIERLERLNLMIAMAADGDVSAIDVSRILRPPGTFNFKRSKPAPVVLILCPWTDHHIGDLEEAFAQVAPQPRIQPHPGGNGIDPWTAYGEGTEPLDIERLWLNLKHGNVHDTQCRVALSLLNHGGEGGDIVEHIVNRTMALLGDEAGWNVDEELKTVNKLVQDGARKIAAKNNQKVTAAPTSPSDWPDPIDILGDRVVQGVPMLTDTMLPRCVIDFAEAESKRLGVDPVAVATVALCVAAAAIHDTIRVTIDPMDDEFVQPAILWVLQIGSPGARKTPTNRAVVKPFRTIEKRWREEWKGQRDQFDADTKKFKAMTKAERGEHEEPEFPPYRQIVVTDATTEALRDVLVDEATAPQLKVLSLQDEIMQLFGGFDAYKKSKGSDRGKWLKLFEGDPEGINRQGVGVVHVEHWSACLLGNIQPDKFRQEGAALSSDGLLQRFIIIRVDEEAARHKERAGSSHQDAWDTVVEALVTLRPRYDNAGNAVRVRGTDFAYDTMEDLGALTHRARYEGAPETLQSAMSKYTGLFARLALTIQMIRVAAGETKVEGNIDDITVGMASEYLLRVVEPNHRHAFIEELRDDIAMEHIRWISQHLLAHKSETITSRELGRAYRKLRGKPEQIEHLMKHLIDAGWCLETGKRGVSITWTINPMVHDRFVEIAAIERERRQKWLGRFASQTSPEKPE